MMMHKINYYNNNLLVVVTVGFTNLEPVKLNPVYRSSLAVSGSLSVMETVEALPVVHLRVVCSQLTIVLLAVSNSRMLGLGGP